MNRKTRISKATGLAFWAAAATLTSPFLANAQSIVYECNLSGAASGNLSGCAGSSTGGYLTSTTFVKGTGLCSGVDYCGVNSNAATAVSPVEAWNICRWVDNTSSQEVFVPFKNIGEWNAFLNNLPALPAGSINISHCAVPWSHTTYAAPNTTTFTPDFGGCTSLTGNTPNLYGRTGISLVPPSPLSQALLSLAIVALHPCSRANNGLLAMWIPRRLVYQVGSSIINLVLT